MIVKIATEVIAQGRTKAIIVHRKNYILKSRIYIIIHTHTYIRMLYNLLQFNSI